jgi:hypothetical protein
MELNFKKNWMKWIDNTMLMKDATFWEESNTMSDWLRSEGKNTLPDLENLVFFSVVDDDDMLDCFFKSTSSK